MAPGLTLEQVQPGPLFSCFYPWPRRMARLLASLAGQWAEFPGPMNFDGWISVFIGKNGTL